MEFIDCACTGKFLTRLVRPAVLMILAESPAHGYIIIQHLEKYDMFKEQPPDVSGIYRTLKSMEEEKLVVSTWDISDNTIPKRCFTITPAGLECLSQWIKTLESYNQAINEILTHTREILKKLNC